MAASLQQRNFQSYLVPRRTMTSAIANSHPSHRWQQQHQAAHQLLQLANDSHQLFSQDLLPSPVSPLPTVSGVPAIMGPQPSASDNSRELDFISHILQASAMDSPVERYNFSSSSSTSPGSNNGTSLSIVPYLPDQESVNLIAEAKAGYQNITGWLKHLRLVSDKVERRAQQTISEINSLKQCVISALDEREKQLLSLVNRVRSLKGQALIQQAEALCITLSTLARWLERATDALDSGGLSPDMIADARRLLASLNAIPFQPCENDLFFFTPAPLSSVTTMGTITSSGYAPLCFAVGKGIYFAQCGNRTTFLVKIKDHLGEEVRVGGDLVSAVHVEPGSQNVWTAAEVVDKGDGTYLVTYCARVEGLHTVHVYLRGRPIAGSPFCVTARYRRNYGAITEPVMTIGSEGANEGQLCRPWGVCCDDLGHIIVADRSNDRIQIFNPDGTFSHCFGQQGKEPGQFNRPAGVDINPAGHIVVTDKDNHRVQVLTWVGKSLLTFGERGSENGQFQYPWDVATSSDGRIVISDSRNHRIQLFTSDGRFINKYGYESTQHMWKHLDSPRGVCFSKQGEVIMTDFNNHKLFVIRPDFTGARYLGCEGQGETQFIRPQGVAVDVEGNIIVADARNNRVQVFDACGSFIAQFGSVRSKDSVQGQKTVSGPRANRSRRVGRGPRQGQWSRGVNSQVQEAVDDNGENLGVSSDLQDGNRVPNTAAEGAAGSGTACGALGPNHSALGRGQERGGIVQQKLPGKEIKNSDGTKCTPNDQGETADLTMMDRPSGLCVSPDGKIILVDFGHNRVLVF